ncbi:glycosyltransferase [Treponema primitia]|uniref:glycosyltransferase n=1 Tax=Treponema primitia TaxID=88058 RepID=UPI00397F4496
MIQPPLFSVLIAQYNNGQYLQESIDSVKAQTYTNWEIIIVDDGSSDNSIELYKQYQNDDRIKIYYNDKNHGCGFTKRRCVEFAAGDVCGFLDSDDALLPDALEVMVKTHNENPGAALVFSRFYVCDDKLQIQGELRRLIIEKGKSYFTNRDYAPEHFAAFKKSFYDKTEGINPQYLIGVDQDLYFKLEEAGSVFVLDKLTYKYRTNRGISENVRRALYWNIIVRHDVCMRRGFNPKYFSQQDFLDYIDDIIAAFQREGVFYFDTGSGFSEKETQLFSFNYNTNGFFKEVVLPLGTKAVRFDPVENAGCIMRNLEVLSVNGQVKYEAINGFVCDDGTMLFSTTDPQILISDVEGLQWLKVRYDIATFTSFEHFHLLDCYKATITELNTVTTELNTVTTELNKVTTELNKVTAERDAAKKTILDLTNSTSWKMTEPIRVTLNKIKRIVRRR